jgi:hypothetical protein
MVSAALRRSPAGKRSSKSPYTRRPQIALSDRDDTAVYVYIALAAVVAVVSIGLYLTLFTSLPRRRRFSFPLERSLLWWPLP